MKEIRHTPGPWYVTERADGRAYSVRHIVPLQCSRLTAHFICHVTDGHPQARENARLIAASPNLLRACMIALDWLVDMGVDPNHPKAKEIREAIFRAGGGEGP